MVKYYRPPETIKVCDTCGERKGINRFNINPRLNTTTCADCRELQSRNKILKQKKILLIASGRTVMSDEENRYTAYRNSARKRNYCFDLSISLFYNIKGMPCIYCGELPPNGIDRYNNDLGYTIENSVPCCWKCNRMKHTMTAEEFITHCKRIADKTRGE